MNQEFQNQYEEEGLLGITQTPYMKDLNKTDVYAKAESGFMGFIVYPLWNMLNIFLNGELNEVVMTLFPNSTLFAFK